MKNLSYTTRLFLALLLFCFITFNEKVIAAAILLGSFQDFIAIKALVCYFLVADYERSIRIWKKIKKYLSSRIEISTTDRLFSLLSSKVDEAEDFQIDGISLEKIIDFLFSTKGFSRDEFISKTGSTRKFYDDLKSKLEDLKILIRGDKNKLILNEEIPVERVVELLSYSTVEDIPPYNMDFLNNNGFVKPSKQETKEVENELQTVENLLQTTKQTISNQIGLEEQTKKVRF